MGIGSSLPEKSLAFIYLSCDYPYVVDDLHEWPFPQEVPVQNDGAPEPAQIDHDDMVSPVVEFSSPVLPKRRKLVSKVWGVFTKVKGNDGMEWAICKHCNKTYDGSSKKGTSNLLKHMEKCPKGTNGDGHKLEKSGMTAPVVNNERNSFYQECNRLDVARMIIMYGCPWSVVEQDLLENSVNDMQPVCKLQSQNNFKADVLRIYRKEKEKLCRSFNKASGLFSFTINLWRHDCEIMYCCLTLHFINDDWELKKNVLAFKRVELGKSYWDLFRTFRSILLDWNINKNVCSVTAQNSEEDDKIVGAMKAWLAYQNSLPFKGKLFHVSCFVNILDLLLEVGFQEVRDVFHKIRRCISYVHSTPDNTLNFRIAADYVRSEGKEVICEDISVSCTLNVQLLERVLGFRDAFDKLQIIDSSFTSNPLVEEWDKATRICECLKVIDEAISSFSGSRCLTANLYFPKACNIYRNLCEWEKIGNSNVHLMASKMKMKFHMFWSKCNLVLAIAVILDPRFKFDIVERWYEKIYGQDAEKHCAGIRDTLTEVYYEYAGGSNNLVSSASLSGNGSSSATSFDTDDMLDPLGMPCTFSHDADDEKTQKSELERYLEEPNFRLVKEFDILNWWHVNTPNFPILSKVARDFLAIPMSAALSNSTFNADVMKIDPTSTDLDFDIMEALICAQDWLQITKRN
ncbi:hypothetical protein ACOSQ4_006325 [Xanthoceras sorbifolium]